MKLIILFALVGILGCLRAVAQPALSDDILAVVNGVPITRVEVMKIVQPGLDLLAVRYRDQPTEIQSRQFNLIQKQLEELIAHQLILFDFTNSGYNLPESLIDEDIQRRIREDYVDRPNFIKTLREKGITYENYRRDLRNDIIVDALMRKHTSDQLVISPHRVEHYYETNKTAFQLEDRVKIRSIELRKTTDGPDAKKMAEEILAKLDAGVPFPEMAAIYSSASQRGKEGDWWERKELKKPLMDAAFALKPGQHTKVIETEEAYHILLVEDVSPAHVKTLAEVRDEIEKTLINEERDRIYNQWISRLEKKTYVYRAIPKPTSIP